MTDIMKTVNKWRNGLWERKTRSSFWVFPFFLFILNFEVLYSIHWVSNTSYANNYLIWPALNKNHPHIRVYDIFGSLNLNYIYDSTMAMPQLQSFTHPLDWQDLRHNLEENIYYQESWFAGSFEYILSAICPWLWEYGLAASCISFSDEMFDWCSRPKSTQKTWSVHNFFFFFCTCVLYLLNAEKAIKCQTVW